MIAAECSTIQTTLRFRAFKLYFQVPMTIFSAALLLFLVMDPFGNIPFFVAELQNVDRSRHLKIILRELLIALGILVLFLFCGQFLLSALHISEPALSTAGGIILFLIAIRMIFPPQTQSKSNSTSEEPFIVPLAVPYVAGPSAMATVILISNRDPDRWVEWLLAVAAAWFVAGAIILVSVSLSRFFNRKILLATEKLMGMILVAIAVQMTMTGIGKFINEL